MVQARSLEVRHLHVVPPKQEEEDDYMTPAEFITTSIRYLRSKGKDIAVLPLSPDYPEFLKLYINGKMYGYWGDIGLASVISQYRQPSYPKSWLASFGLPPEL